MARGRFRWDLLGVALVASLALHVFVVIPQIVLPLMERPKEPLEVSYVPELEQSTDETTKLDEKKPEERADRTPESKQKVEEPPKPLPPKPPEVAQIEQKKPEPPEPPKPPPSVQPPPPPPMPKTRMKMVDQDRAEEEPDNADAKYLAQKNHKAAEETRALNTNLVRNSAGAEQAPSEPSQNLAPNVGMAKPKIAELEERKGKEHQPKKEIVRSKPLRGDEGREKAPPKPGKLSMRGLTPRAAEPVEGERQREGLELDQSEKGPLPSGRVGQGEERAAPSSKGGRPRMKLALTPEDYDRIEGEGVAEKERRDAARAEQSHPAGRWARVQRQMAMMRSSLENFTPEVKPGNQSELGTRAHPFAAYIAEMHRGIHKLWADGFIADVEGKGISNPYNDMELWTQVEIVIKADGTLAKAPTIVRPSGYTPFDVAAMDTVMSAAPFPPPPAAIKSANGKVYVDWRFHRDDRLCGTIGVDPHILTTPAEENKDHDTSEMGKSTAAPGPASPPSFARAQAPSSTRATPPSQHLAPPPEPSSPVADHVPADARKAAHGWFDAYVRGDAGWLAGWSAAPFSAGGIVAAKDGAAVKRMYAALLEESAGDRRLDDTIEVYTSIGIRGKLGSLPPGGETEMMYAVARVGAEQMVLLLKQSNAGWRVCGLNRG